MSEHTPGPWVQFATDGKCIAIMPAGREGDICTFMAPPCDADARLMTSAPELVIALTELSAMYTHAWDRVDGGLTMFGPSVQRFENAHWAAQVALAHANGTPVPVVFEDDEDSIALSASPSQEADRG